jgi:Tol biopolymer transport system component
MNEPRFVHLTDGLIRSAITEEPPSGTEAVLWPRLTMALGETSQRRRALIAWPWTPALPGLPRSRTQRRLRAIAVLATVALLIVSSIAVGLLIGSFHRLPPPFGLTKAGLVTFDAGGDVYVANADGTGIQQLTAGDRFDLEPTWSPDGTRIAFQSRRDPGSNQPSPQDTIDLVVMDPDGGHRAVIWTKPAMTTVYDPNYIDWSRVAWSPDSRSIAFTGRVNGTDRIFIAHADGSSTVGIGDPGFESQDPAWSPDGTRIAFRGGRFDKERSLYVMNVDGSGLRPLIPPTDGPIGNTYSYWHAAWSPDGTTIAFTKETEQFGQQVWLFDLASGTERLVPDCPRYCDYPTWSPDGRQLAYYVNDVLERWSKGHFAIVNADGSSDPVVLAPEIAGAPVWSPDGRKLIGFVLDDMKDVNKTVKVIDIATGTATIVPPRADRAPDDDDINGIPSWQRLAK